MQTCVVRGKNASPRHDDIISHVLVAVCIVLWRLCCVAENCCTCASFPDAAMMMRMVWYITTPEIFC